MGFFRKPMGGAFPFFPLPSYARPPLSATARRLPGLCPPPCVSFGSVRRPAALSPTPVHLPAGAPPEHLHSRELPAGALHPSASPQEPKSASLAGDRRLPRRAHLCLREHPLPPSSTALRVLLRTLAPSPGSSIRMKILAAVATAKASRCGDWDIYLDFIWSKPLKCNLFVVYGKSTNFVCVRKHEIFHRAVPLCIVSWFDSDGLMEEKWEIPTHYI